MADSHKSDFHVRPETLTDFTADFGPQHEIEVKEGRAIWVDMRSPDGHIWSGLCKSITIPGTKGSFGVLPRHAPLMSSLEVGLTKVTGLDGQVRKFVTGPGFVEVYKNFVLMLTDFGDRTDEIDVERAKAARDRAETRLRSHEENLDRARADAAMERAVMRMRYAGQG